MRRILVGIPPGARVELGVLSEGTRRLGPYNVLPVPDLILQTHPLDQLGPWNAPPSFDERLVESPVVYETDAQYPGAVARLVEVGYLRDQRVAVIELFPAQYNPVSQLVWFHPRLQIEISFSYPDDKGRVWSSRQEVRNFEQLLSDQLVNYGSAREFRGTAAEFSASDDRWPLASEAYKIYVDQDGIYRLSYHDLAAAGAPVDTLDPRTLQIYSMGQEVAIRVMGQDDGRFDQDDHVLFYGQGIRNKYTNENVYWLTYGHKAGQRMAQRDGTPSGSVPFPSFFDAYLRLEENTRYSSQWPGDDSTDRWFW
jgi:hypothetical protein